MTLQELLVEIKKQPAWHNGDQRAPHKYLTLLYALGQLLHGCRLTRYEAAEPQLKALLDRFGPPRQTPHPEQPVWRLAEYQRAPTRFWELEGDLSGLGEAGANPSIPLLRERVAFGFSKAAAEVLANETNSRILTLTLVQGLVPETLQSDLLDAVGIGADLPTSDDSGAEEGVETALRERRPTWTLRRDPSFARRVRSAYQNACAICSIAPRVGSDLFGLEAAHIRWVQANGPDTLPNGLCLCCMHHKALDYGALRVDESMKVCISPKLNATASDSMFGQFDGKPIRLPSARSDWPDSKMLEWHCAQVFRP